MIRKYITRTVVLLVFVDQCVLIASLAAALWLKKHVLLADPLLPVRLHVDLFIRLWPFLAIGLAASGAYRLHIAVGGLKPLLHRVVVSTAVMAAVWTVGTFYLKMSDLFSYSRGVFSLFLIFSAIGLAAARLLVAEIATLWRRRTGRSRRVLVFGGESLGGDIIRNLQKQIFVPVDVVETTGNVDLPGVVRLTVAEALQQIRQGQVDHVIIDLPPRHIRLLLQVSRIAEREGVPLQITPTVFPGLHLNPRVGQIGEIPLLELNGNELPVGGLLAKRTFDLGCSALGLAVLSPVFLAVGIIIKLTSRGPVFYVQERVGLDGCRFRMFKFRTMRQDAENESGPVWATEDDPRTTPIGRFLRKTNVDEWPQLWNVLTGSMSLVGPRPERPEFVEQFKPTIERYSHKHWVKPGMTGWAQVNGWRGCTDLATRIRHDIHYMERWSFWFDLRILVWTLIRQVRKPDGPLEQIPPPSVSTGPDEPRPVPPAWPTRMTVPTRSQDPVEIEVGAQDRSDD